MVAQVDWYRLPIIVERVTMGRECVQDVSALVIVPR
jgi:hypothetical protein